MVLAEDLRDLTEVAGLSDYAGGALTGHAGLRSCIQSGVSNLRHSTGGPS
jgi:hypothetical protein